MKKVHDVIFKDTSFAYSCSIYKDYNIPILEDAHTGQCKDHVKHILNTTKNPLSQSVDVLIPSLDKRNKTEKLKLQNIKRFFGKQYIACKDEKPSSEYPLLQQQRTTSKNACTHDTPISNNVNELIDVEESHFLLLEEFVNNFMAPIKDSIDDPKKVAILDLYTFKRIFRNTNRLFEVHKSFYHSLIQYRQASTTESFGEILSKHIDGFSCYKTFYLGHTDAIRYHKHNIKKNSLYRKLAGNTTFKGNLYAENALERFFGLPMKYTSLLKSMIKRMQPNDSDTENVLYVIEKLDHINQRHYGDSFVLSLYHHIRDPPDSLIKPRELLSYFDATELSFNGRYLRPVIILVFTDKLMVVKRKNSSLQGKDLLDNIQDKFIDQPSNNVIMQKIKEVYNGYPLEFKGWVDLSQVELFQGLEGRQETFFLRTNLPEQDSEDTEKEYEEYFRKSDRLYSLLPHNSMPSSLDPFIDKRNQLVAICQKQRAISKLEGTEDMLYMKNKYKIPTYTHFHNEESYTKAKHKSHILVIYVEERYPSREIDINSLVDENVWVVMLLRDYTSGGCKLTIRSRTNLTPTHQVNRNPEYECLIEQSRNKDQEQLDFIDTLWNNIFYYERQLRVSREFSMIHDRLLHGRNKSRSRSKSISRIASNISLGKLFPRSRSSSPSRRSSIDGDKVECDATTSEPVIDVATVTNNNAMEKVFRNAQTSDKHLHLTSNDVAQNAHGSNLSSEHHKTQPRTTTTTTTTRARPLSAIFMRNTATTTTTTTMESRNKQEQDTPLLKCHDPHPSLDSVLFNYNNNNRTPELISSSNNEPPSGDLYNYAMNDNMSVESSTSASLYNNTVSSTQSYYGLDTMTDRERYNNNSRSYRGTAYDEKRLMAMIDNSAVKRAPMATDAFYCESPQPIKFQSTPLHKTSNMSPPITDYDINDMINELIHSQSTKEKNTNSYYRYSRYRQRF